MEALGHVVCIVLYVWMPQKSLNVDCWTVSVKGQEVEISGHLEKDRGINKH